MGGLSHLFIIHCSNNIIVYSTTGKPRRVEQSVLRKQEVLIVHNQCKVRIITSGSKTQVIDKDDSIIKTKRFQGNNTLPPSFSETSVQLLCSLRNGSIFPGYKDTLVLG